MFSEQTFLKKNKEARTRAKKRLHHKSVASVSHGQEKFPGCYQSNLYVNTFKYKTMSRCVQTRTLPMTAKYRSLNFLWQNKWMSGSIVIPFRFIIRVLKLQCCGPGRLKKLKTNIHLRISKLE